MRETNERRVELKDTNVASFKMLLQYIYTGKISLLNMKEDMIIEILGLAHKYGFTDLEVAVSAYLEVRFQFKQSKNKRTCYNDNRQSSNHAISAQSTAHRFCTTWHH